MKLLICNRMTGAILATVLIQSATMDGTVTAQDQAQATILRGKLIQFDVEYSSRAESLTFDIDTNSTDLLFQIQP